MASHPIHEHSLHRQIALVRRRAKGWLLAMGASAVLASFIGAAIFLGTVDYVLRFELRPVRLALSLAAPSVTIVAAWLFLWPALRLRLTEGQVARRLESYFPALRGRLASSLEFLRLADADPVAGSPELRRQTVAETALAAESLPLGEALDTRAPKCVSALAALACLALAALVAFAPEYFETGVKRLSAPWGSDVWPRRHRLEFVDAPRRIAVGDDLEFVVIDRNGRLPSDVRLEYRLGKGAVRRQPMRRDADGRGAGGRATLRLNSVGQSLVYRAAGGDDLQSSWRRLEAIAPVRVASLEVTIHPPEYTSQSPRRSATSIRALVGSRIEIRGAADQRLSSAKLIVETPSGNRQIELDIGVNRRAFATRQLDENPDARKREENDWTVQESGRWRLQLLNEKGIGLGAQQSGRQRGDELQALADESPSIAIESDPEAAIVTARALAPLVAVVKDDLAIAAARLEFRIELPAPADAPPAEPRRTEPAPGAIELFRGPVPATAFAEGQELPILYRWNLSSLTGLQPGQTIYWTILAEDYLGQSTRSSEQRLTVVSEEDLEHRLQERQTRLFAKLASTLRAQVEARTQTGALAAPIEPDSLRSAGLLQQMVRDRAEDTSAAAGWLLTAYENNQLEDADPIQRLRALAGELASLLEGDFPEIENRMLELVRQDTAAAASAAEFLATITAGQDRVVSRLEQLLERLGAWDNFRRFARELARFRADQSDLLVRTSRHRLAAFSEVENPGDELAAERGQLAPRQIEIADGFAKLETRWEVMQQASQEKSNVDAQAAVLTAAIDAARRTALGEVLRNAGRALEEGRLGEAEQLQRQSLAAFDELLDIFLRRQRDQLAGAAERLREARRELTELTDEQRSAQEHIDNGNEQALSAAADRERQVADRSQALAGRLREQAANAAAHLQSAAVSAADSAAAASGGRRAEAAHSAGAAQRELDSASAALDRELNETERRLADERLALLAQALSATISRQREIVAPVETLAVSFEAGESLDRAGTAQIAELAAAESQLAAELRDLPGPFAEAHAIVFALRFAADSMEVAAKAWSLRDLGGPGRRAAQAALERLMQLHAALDASTPPSAPPATGRDGATDVTGDEPRQPPKSSPAGNRFLLAQLKFLLVAQQTLNERMSELDSDGGANSQVASELAAEQEQLADLLQELVKPSDEVSETP